MAFATQGCAQARKARLGSTLGFDSDVASRLKKKAQEHFKNRPLETPSHGPAEERMRRSPGSAKMGLFECVKKRRIDETQSRSDDPIKAQGQET